MGSIEVCGDNGCYEGALGLWGLCISGDMGRGPWDLWGCSILRCVDAKGAVRGIGSVEAVGLWGPWLLRPHGWHSLLLHVSWFPWQH